MVYWWRLYPSSVRMVKSKKKKKYFFPLLQVCHFNILYVSLADLAALSLWSFTFFLLN